MAAPLTDRENVDDPIGAPSREQHTPFPEARPPEMSRPAKPPDITFRQCVDRRADALAVRARPSRRSDLSAAGRTSIRQPSRSVSSKLRLSLRPRHAGIALRL